MSGPGGGPASKPLAFLVPRLRLLGVEVPDQRGHLVERGRQRPSCLDRPVGVLPEPANAGVPTDLGVGDRAAGVTNALGELGDKVRKALDGKPDPEVTALLATAQLLDADTIDRREPVDLGNGRLRRLAADTVDRGWWRLLWLPPSLPYHALDEPFAAAAAEGITKRLLFSSWNATPTAVAGLLSYEAQRRLGHTGEGHRHLDYRTEHDRPAAMSVLALFWPHPALAALCDPQDLTRQRPDETAPLDVFEHEVRERLRAHTSVELALTTPRPAEPWELVFRWPGADPGIEDAAAALGTSADEDRAATGLDRHVARARELASHASYPTTGQLDGLLDSVMAIGMHGPGNIAWRALSRLIHPGDAVTPAGHWRAAALLANGLRSLFNRPESAQLLESLSMGQVYWQAVLRYCAAGGLQAVLDEHLHTLRSAASDTRLDDDELYRLADEARQAIASRPSTYEAFDPIHPDQPIKLPGRFALRYGGRGEEQSQVDRKAVVRRAFNSHSAATRQDSTGSSRIWRHTDWRSANHGRKTC